MHGEEEAIVEGGCFGLVGWRREFLDGYRMDIKILLQVQDIFRSGIRHVDPRNLAKRNGFHEFLFENEASLLYHINHEETASLVDCGVSKNTFPRSRTRGESYSSSCLSVLYVVLGVRAAGYWSFRRLPRRIPCPPTFPAMPPLAPRRL